MAQYSNFKPQERYPTPAYVLIPAKSTSRGVTKNIYPTDMKNCELIFCSFKTYGGTEKSVNGIYSVEDTANVETWYTPEIKSDCRIRLAENNAEYEILNEPEDIDMRHRCMKFKVRRIKGGV